MVVVYVVVAVVIVALLARLMQLGGVPRVRRARPGEDITRPEAPIHSDVVDLGEYDREEAAVILALLDSNGIPATLQAARGDELYDSYRIPPRRQRLLVAADRADEARALLSGE